MTAETGATNTSSIGAAWPPVESNNNRIRGFFPETLSSTEAVEEFVDTFYAQKLSMESADHAGTDRLSLRAVAKIGAIAMLQDAGIEVEGAMPLARSAAGLHMVYAGYNKTHRQLSEAKLAEHQQLLDGVHRRTSRHHNLEGFSTHILDRTSPDYERKLLKSEFLDLYGTFGFSDDDTEELLLNPNNVIAYMRAPDSRIVSTALAERAEISLDDRDSIAVAEVTEAATLPEYRGRGLYTRLSSYLVQQVVRHEDSLDLLYGESNLASPGVIHAAQLNGRRFAYHDRSSYGANSESFGILAQNFSVNDGREDRPYNDFALSHVPLVG